MKTKLFLLLSVLFCGSSLFAEDGNLLVNGDFEDENYVSYSLYISDVLNAIDIPGFDKRTDWGLQPRESDGVTDYALYGVETWNVNVEIMQHELSGGLIDDDNYQYLRVQRNLWNGWSQAGIYQTFNIVPGAEYTFSGIYAVSKGTTRDNETDIPRVIRFIENGQTSNPIVFHEISLPQEDKDWTAITEKLPALESEKMTIYLGIKGGNGQESQNNNVWVDFDDLQVVGPTVGYTNVLDDVISIEKVGSQIIVSGAEIGSPISLYSISGNLLASGVVDSDNYVLQADNYAKGVYVIKVNNISRKVIL